MSDNLISDPLAPEDNKEVELSPAQEKKMLDFWNVTPGKPPGLKEIIHHVWDDTTIDGRDAKGKAVKKSLARHSLKAKSSHDYQPKDEIELSEAHESYIKNNAKSMGALEMAKIIFNNPTLSNLHAETRAVNEFIKTLDVGKVLNPTAVADVPVEEYKPPKTLEQVIKRVNDYVFFPTKDELNAQQKKQMMTLMSYLQVYRFTRQMNIYDSEGDRKLCEDSFIRGTYDKSDLAQEEIDQYIELANQVVLASKIARRSEKLQIALETLSNQDAETMKISMSLTEAIGKASTEYHQCQSRQATLLSSLTQKRSARLDKQIRDNSSVLNLVQMWKEEEGRVELLKHAELEQQAMQMEVNRLTSLPEIKARILGLPKEEVLNG